MRTTLRSGEARTRLVRTIAASAAAAALSGCGGSGGSDGPTPTATTAPSTPTTTVSNAIDYPNSVTLGGTGAVEDLAYTPAASVTASPVVRAQSASTLLHVGDNPVTAEHVEATLPGLRTVCVSGNGESTNVVTGINLGVLSKSAAVLMDRTWSTVDATSAWSNAVSRGGSFLGWENCGVKPEGLPSPSSRLTPRTDGGYAEDIYDGNPGTTYNVVSRTVAPATVSAMLSASGYATVDDPQRPLRITLRAYQNNTGNVVFVERGEPGPTAAAGVRGFIALYVRGT